MGAGLDCGSATNQRASAKASRSASRIRCRRSHPQRLQAGQLETLQDVERQQGRHPLAVGPAFPDSRPAVSGRHGQLPTALVRGQIGLSQHAAAVPNRLGDGPSDIPPVVGCRSAGRDRPQGASQARIVENLPRHRGPAADGELLAAQGGRELPLRPQRPEVSGDGCDRKPALGQLRGGPQHLRQRKPAVPFYQVAPGGAGARDRHGEGLERRQGLLESTLLQQLQRKSGRCPAGTVERGDLPGGGLDSRGRSSRRRSRWRWAR